MRCIAEMYTCKSMHVCTCIRILFPILISQLSTYSPRQLTFTSFKKIEIGNDIGINLKFRISTLLNS